jgi:hypothetical protein
MTLKQFFKPNKRNLVIFVILFIISSSVEYGAVEMNRGFPFAYIRFFVETSHYEFDIISLLLDAIIYYLLSCSTLWAYDKDKQQFQIKNWKQIIGYILIIIAGLYGIGTPSFDYWNRYGRDMKPLVGTFYFIGLFIAALIFILGCWIIYKYKK